MKQQLMAQVLVMGVLVILGCGGSPEPQGETSETRGDGGPELDGGVSSGEDAGATEPDGGLSEDKVSADGGVQDPAPDGYSLGPDTQWAGQIGWFDGAESSTACPPGAVATGMELEINTARGVFLSVGLRCASLGRDGRLGAESITPPAGAPNDFPTDSSLCPSGQVVAGVAYSTGSQRLSALAALCGDLTELTSPVGTPTLAAAPGVGRPSEAHFCPRGFLVHGLKVVTKDVSDVTRIAGLDLECIAVRGP